MLNQSYKFFTLWRQPKTGFSRWHYWHSFKSKTYGLRKILKSCILCKTVQIICIERFYIDSHGKNHIDCEYLKFDSWNESIDELTPISLSDIEMSSDSFNDFFLYAGGVD